MELGFKPSKIYRRKQRLSAFYFFDVKKVGDPDKLEEYRQHVFETVERYAGKYRVIGGAVETVEGDWHPNFTVLVEFENAEKARRWFDSPEYDRIKSLRREATESNVILIDGAVLPPGVSYEF